jgi:hypothetical protein
MRIPLESYLQGRTSKVFSLVAEVPFSPLDIDLGHLARGEWNAQADRFRVWYVPSEKVDGDQTCYVMVRKFDPEDGVLICGHFVVNLRGAKAARSGFSFTVGILSNDDIRARAMLNSLLDIPPSYHKRNELRVVERKWRDDSDAVLRFLANVHSALMNAVPDPGGRVYTLKFEPPPGMMDELRKGMGAWWRE